MNTKKKLLFSFVGLILAISVFATVVFAWFAISSATGDFIVETGTIETDVYLYKGTWDSADNKYNWGNPIVDSDDVTEIFHYMIPGQIITFKLELTNKAESSVKVNYEVKLGEILYCSDIKVDSPNYESVDSSLADTNQHLLNAITLWHSVAYSSKDQALNDQEIKELYTPSDNTPPYSPDTGSVKLSAYLTNATLIEKKVNNVIEAGETVTYYLKFYFNPTFGTSNVEPTTNNSNAFQNKGFTISQIYINFTQKEEITE